MTTGMKMSHHIAVCLVGILLAIGIILIGKLSADGFRRYASEQTQQLVYNIIRGVDVTATEVLTDDRFYDLADKYIRELGDVYSSFAYFPRGDLAVFLTVAKNLPHELMVDSFDHEGRDLVIHISGTERTAIENYGQLLRDSGRFTQVTVTIIKEKPMQATVVCKGFVE